MNAIWDGRSDGPGMRQLVGLDWSIGGVILGANMGYRIVTNGEFAA